MSSVPIYIHKEKRSSKPSVIPEEEPVKRKKNAPIIKTFQFTQIESSSDSESESFESEEEPVFEKCYKPELSKTAKFCLVWTIIIKNLEIFSS